MQARLEKVEQLVTTMRNNGALVGYTTGNPDSAAVDVLQGYGNDRYFVSVEYVDEAVSALHMRMMLGDVTKADMLLVCILENAGILQKQGDQGNT